MLALLTGYYLRARENILPDFLQKADLGTFPSLNTYVKLSFVGAVRFVILLSLFRLYSMRVSDSLARELRKIFFASLIWLMTVITYYFVIRDFPFSRMVLFYSAFLLFVFIGVDRVIIKKIQRHFLRMGIGRRRMVLVGKNLIAEEL